MSCATAQNGKLIADIEDTCKKLPSTHVWRVLDIPTQDIEPIKTMLHDLAARVTKDPNYPHHVRDLQRTYHRAVKPSHFTQVYLEEVETGKMKKNLALENLLITSRCRGISGVSVVTVFLSANPDGQTFTCKWDCHYCPKEPGQPRSYLFGEPGVLRANQHGFDCAKQMWNRINAYKVNGHPTDKFEVLILGGTIHSYPKSYLETFMRDIFYAANTCEDPPSMDGPDGRRERLSLAEEKTLNNASEHRVIGITVETRPDCVNAAELRDFRRWGVTRVQIGVQHTDDAILRAVNRGCYHKHTLRAMKLLRDACFKVDIHLMPNLPTATPEKDKAMFDIVLQDLHPDQVKVYPCETTPFTKILEDYKAGIYKPYGNDDLTEVVVYWKTRVHPWIRNNRIVRDIPDNYIVAGVKTSSQRCEFQSIMKARGLQCRCIRCREAGRHPTANPSQGVLKVRTYKAQDGVEHFISWETPDEQVLFGFCRLRLPSPSAEATESAPVFEELTPTTALVRELHVYGRTFAVGTGAQTAAVGNTAAAQHFGIGRRLLAHAEHMALSAGFKQVAVISGVGVRNYYERSGYTLAPGIGEFMMKLLEVQKPAKSFSNIILPLPALLIVLVMVAVLAKLLFKGFMNLP